MLHVSIELFVIANCVACIKTKNNINKVISKLKEEFKFGDISIDLKVYDYDKERNKEFKILDYPTVRMVIETNEDITLKKFTGLIKADIIYNIILTCYETNTL